MSILFNFLVQLISKEILSVNNQELRFFHTNHGGPAYWRMQKTHFLLGGKGQRKVRGHLWLPASSLTHFFPASISTPTAWKSLFPRLQVPQPALCSHSLPLLWVHSSLLICYLRDKRQQAWPGQREEAGEASQRSWGISKGLYSLESITNEEVGPTHHLVQLNRHLTGKGAGQWLALEYKARL